MRKKIVVFSLLVILIAFLNSQSRIPRADCCYQVWAAGCNIGWSTSLMYYTKIRERWSVFDRNTYNMILTAGRHIESAYRSCSSGAKAWPGWRAKQNQLNSIARSFMNNPTSLNREQCYNKLRATYSFASGLRWAVAASRLVKTSTCAEHYFKLGVVISNAQQTLKIADENYRQRGNNYFNWKLQVADAKRSLLEARKVLFNYFKLRPMTGSCVNITDLEVDKKLKKIGRLGTTHVNLLYMIRVVDWIQLNLQNRLRRRCSSRVRPPVNPPRPPNPGNNSPPPVDVSNANQRHFVGQFKMADPKRSHAKYNGKLNLKTNNTFTSLENAEGRSVNGKGKWSYNPSTLMFIIDWDSGGKFSGRVSGNTNNFTISGNWGNGQSGRLNIYR